VLQDQTAKKSFRRHNYPVFPGNLKVLVVPCRVICNPSLPTSPMADVLTAKIDAQGLKIREMKVPV
jgi:hypothetical protein